MRLLAICIAVALAAPALAQRIPPYLGSSGVTPFNAFDGLDSEARVPMALGLLPPYGGGIAGLTAYALDGSSWIVYGAPIGGLIVGPVIGYAAAGQPGRGVTGALLRGATTGGALAIFFAVAGADDLEGVDDLALVGAVGGVAALVVFVSWARDTYYLREQLRSDAQGRTASVSFIPIEQGGLVSLSVPL